jgi:NAD(P)-dependent dehydrogenase (short-subunit alcohol dehydrogenase family)
VSVESVALVTGGSRGIGRGISLALGANGWRVVINYRLDRVAAEAAGAAVEAAGGEAFPLQCDIGQLEAHDGLVRGVLERFGRLDLLVNNAGMAPRQRVDMLRTSPESYDEVMRTNLKGPFFLTQRVANEMIAQLAKGAIQEPKIVNISSISASASNVDRAEYCLSKAGISMMTALWANRLAEFGINVYEIRPGIVATDMTAGVKAKYDRLIMEEGMTLLPRWGQPEDVGKAVAAIALGLLPYSTGEVIHVDGGFHVPRF